MLLIVPSSETKRPPAGTGDPVVLEALSFPELTPVRASILDALVETSGAPDAFRRLLVRPSLAEEVVRNTHLRELPASPALEVYAGALQEALDYRSLPPAARRRAARDVVVVSALWGALRPDDRIPPYRLNVCARLLDMDPPERIWRAVLPGLLAGAARPGDVILDLRSVSSRAIGMPAGLGDRTVTLRVEGRAGERVGDVLAKRERGRVARHLLETGEDPPGPVALASVLQARWQVRLDEPARRGAPWSMTVAITG